MEIRHGGNWAPCQQDAKHKGQFPDECAERISRKALEDSAAATDPRTATAGEIKMLIEEAITKAR